ncbi:MAG TPA: phytanoyl-CoA dioxygenase family protein [Acidimicrobiales bacterium]|nr:phytanoyl-CoA dioxygenase family protein [Acidimicrobiales bacterium]
MAIDTLELIGRTAPGAGMELATPWVESPLFAAELASRELTEAERQMAVRYHEDGYVVLLGLADDAFCDRIREETEPLFRPPFEPGRSATRAQDAWKVSPAARALATHPRVMAALSMLYGRRPLPFQTLNFPVGTQQRAHSDSIHFSCLPARYMCGVWVALEDTELDNGPLFYYPGSQRLPEFDYQDLALPDDQSGEMYGRRYELYEDRIEALMAAAGFERRRLVVRKGDALLWSSNLVHGGSPILRPGASRWSQVTHYFFEGCIYYTPLMSNRVTGELALRNHLVDIATGTPLVHSYSGSKVVMAEAPGGRFRIAIV